jgi:hypothetical protein
VVRDAQEKKMNNTEPFLFHGVNIASFPEKSNGQAQGDCILCGKEEHFFLQPETGLWDCKRCGASGNATGFLEQLHEKIIAGTTNADYLRLKKLRGVRSHVPFQRAGMGWNKEKNRWVLPVRSSTGYMCNLRLWQESRKGETKPFINTKGLKSGLWGMELLGVRGMRKRKVWVCEGEWDGMELRGIFKKQKIDDLVVAVPGANVFKKDWIEHFAGRDVVLAYDADVAGDNGMVKYGDMLGTVARTVRYVRWPLDVNSGYDVSDLIDENKDDCKKSVTQLKKLVSKAPRTVSLRVNISEEGKKDERRVLGFNGLQAVYEKWLDMGDDSVLALKMIASVVLSNQISGDPLWIYLVAPPGAGKTVLINPLRSLDEHAVFRSNLTKTTLVSGWQGQGDPSLLPLLDGKTLVLKDMTEILSAPQHVQDEVFGTLRGAYDGSVERSYGNEVKRKYELTFSMIAGVTVAIHGHHQANMGERLLKVQMFKTDEEQEEIIRRAMMNIGKEEKMEEEMSGAFDRFLRRKLDLEKLRARVSEKIKERISSLAQLVSKLRMEVERDYRGDQVKYRPQDEVGSRLAKQLLKIGMLVTETNAKKEFGEEEWRIVERVAFDTAIGWNLDVVQAMMQGNGKMTRADLVKRSKLPPSNVQRRLEDLTISGIIHEVKSKQKFGASSFRVKDRIQELWNRVRVVDDHSEVVSEIRKSRRYKIRQRRRST